MESYKEKYNKLVEAIKVLQETNPSDEGIQSWVHDNVPELAESEGERIRKALKQGFFEYGNSFTTFGGIQVGKIIAWLEKQGEQKPKKFTFNAIPRLLEMLPLTDRANVYCQKLIDKLEQEGYCDDAKIAKECLKLANVGKVAMATMDEEQSTDDVDPKKLNANKVIEWLYDQACLGWIEDIEVDKFVDKFKKHFGL